MADEKIEKFLLPPPQFRDEIKKSLDDFSRHLNPHFSTPNGMLLPRDKQPPPMYGPRGSTVPPQFMSNPRKRSTPYHQGVVNNRPNHPYERNNQRPPFKQAGGYKDRPQRPNNGLEKDVKPELLRLDWKLWCEGCDVNCRTEEEYQRHLSNHTLCTVPGCKFVGHPMIMKRHERRVHNEGANGTASAGPSIEEIEQWKEERRKRFPTKQNVILRQQAQEERFNRGERIEANKERFPNRHVKPPEGCRENDGIKSGLPATRGQKRSKNRKRNRQPAKVAIVEEKPERIAFAGTSMLKDYREPSKNALGLLGDYGTESENTSEEEESTLETVDGQKSQELPACKEELDHETVLSEGELADEECVMSYVTCTAAAESTVTQGRVPGIQQNGISGKTIPEKGGNAIGFSANMPHPKHPDTSSRQQQKQQQAVKRNNPKGKEIRKEKKYLLDYSKLRRANQNTMLEKLLDSDIRHERNVLLQCVRHVLAHNFFGIGQHSQPCTSGSSVSDDTKE